MLIAFCILQAMNAGAGEFHIPQEIVEWHYVVWTSIQDATTYTPSPTTI